MKKILVILFLFLNMLTAGFSQRVGINTSAPQETLDVRGNVYLSDKLGIGITNPQFPVIKYHCGVTAAHIMGLEYKAACCRFILMVPGQILDLVMEAVLLLLKKCG